MIPRKIRLKILSRFAQTTSTSTTTTTTADSTTSATTAPPPAFQASAAWGWLTSSYNQYSVTLINNLVALLNTALHYSSQGKYNWQILRDQNFNIDPSGEPSIDTKNLLIISRMVFLYYINSGNQFAQKVSGNQIVTWNNMISQSQAFLGLSQVSPTGVIAQRIPGTFKENILTVLRLLAQYNPVQQAR